ncbi:hypothetical protein ACJRO7_001840 [Eucalyptus globulus]|uniref:Uncharacterized protein n=1 Tax=Eucalyptus globulus TaxID=34317 RepID=A0ABD3M266_EUCGL
MTAMQSSLSSFSITRSRTPWTVVVTTASSLLLPRNVYSVLILILFCISTVIFRIDDRSRAWFDQQMSRKVLARVSCGVFGGNSDGVHINNGQVEMWTRANHVRRRDT